MSKKILTVPGLLHFALNDIKKLKENNMKFEFSPYIAVQVKNYDKAIDFYKRVMGMELVEVKGNDTYLKSGPLCFVFENVPEGKSVFFEFKVNNVKNARELLEKEGCKVTQVYNEKSMMFSDPFGMNFHVWED
jgi:catechol 2,3-dioxygenase-like lactoylglutathione lyase family enzyme